MTEFKHFNLSSFLKKNNNNIVIYVMLNKNYCTKIEITLSLIFMQMRKPIISPVYFHTLSCNNKTRIELRSLFVKESKVQKGENRVLVHISLETNVM